jgi:hypothetical protein
MILKDTSLWYQPLAAFGTTSSEDVAACFGRHALHEAMGAFSLDVARLKSPFAHSDFLTLSLDYALSSYALQFGCDNVAPTS